MIDIIEEYKAGKRDFTGANLRFANLRFADLQDANLQRANLQDANLQRANLQRANLRGANLQHCNGVRYACLGNYQMLLHEGMVHAGCRYFTIEQAKAHWSPGNEHKWTEKTADYGAKQRKMLEFLT